MSALALTLGPATVGHRPVLAGGRVVALVRADRDLVEALSELAARGYCVSYRDSVPYLLVAE